MEWLPSSSSTPRQLPRDRNNSPGKSILLRHDPEQKQVTVKLALHVLQWKKKHMNKTQSAVSNGLQVILRNQTLKLYIYINLWRLSMDNLDNDLQSFPKCLSSMIPYCGISYKNRTSHQDSVALLTHPVTFLTYILCRVPAGNVSYVPVFDTWWKSIFLIVYLYTQNTE